MPVVAPKLGRPKGKIIPQWCGNFRIFLSFKILRESNFTESRSAESAVFAILKALNFDFYEFLHFLEAEIDQTNIFKAP